MIKILFGCLFISLNVGMLNLGLPKRCDATTKQKGTVGSKFCSPDNDERSFDQFVEFNGNIASSKSNNKHMDISYAKQFETMREPSCNPSGAFGCVSLYKNDNKLYALKQFSGSTASEVNKNFNQEIHSFEKINNINANIPKMHYFSPTYKAILMDGINGYESFDYFQKTGIEPHAALTLINKAVEQLIKIVNELHSKNIYILDLKPENIMIEVIDINSLNIKVWLIDVGGWVFIDESDSNWKKNNYDISTTKQYSSSSFLQIYLMINEYLQDTSKPINYEQAKEYAIQGDKISLAKTVIIWVHMIKITQPQGQQTSQLIELISSLKDSCDEMSKLLMDTNNIDQVKHMEISIRDKLHNIQIEKKEHQKSLTADENILIENLKDLLPTQPIKSTKRNHLL